MMMLSPRLFLVIPPPLTCHLTHSSNLKADLNPNLIANRGTTPNRGTKRVGPLNWCWIVLCGSSLRKSRWKRFVVSYWQRRIAQCDETVRSGRAATMQPLDTTFVFTLNWQCRAWILTPVVTSLSIATTATVYAVQRHRLNSSRNRLYIDF